MNLYFHIPFCARACEYCYYLKEVGATRDQRETYLKALGSELSHRLPQTPPGRRVETVYVGGGTPTLLSVRELREFGRILAKCLNAGTPDEFTFETTPAECRPEKLEFLRQIGVTRLSIGVQSIDDTLLESINRGSLREGTIENVDQAVSRARAAGFTNINCDLILGLPGETDSGVADGIDLLIGLGVPHMSLYPLQVGTSTELFAKLAVGQLRMDAACKREARYQKAIDKLLAGGYRRLGISHFATCEQYRCKHHLNVWNGAELLGFGASAQSYSVGQFMRNRSGVSDYVTNCPADTVEKSVALTHGDQARRWVYMQLSRRLEVDLAEFESRWGLLVAPDLVDTFQRLVSEGFALRRGKALQLTPAGTQQTTKLITHYLHFDSREYTQYGLRGSAEAVRQRELK